MRIGWLAALPLLFGCQSSGSFGCSEDGQCESAGITGTCETNGYCGFLDDTCPSGRRYGDLAGEGLAAVCVPEVPGSTGLVSTTDASGTGTSTSTSTSEVPTTSTASSGEPETSGGFSCEPSGVCSDDPPPGWSGPIVLEPSGKGACGGAPAWTAGTGLVPESACNCDCESEPTAGVQCQFSGVGGPDCVGLSLPIALAPGDCVSASPFAAIESINTVSDQQISCAAPAPLSAALDQVFAACDPRALGRCEDGTACIEEPQGGSVCDWRDGVHDCPSRADQRTVLYREATGGYDCGCQCGASSPCNTLLVFVDPACSGEPLEFPVAQFPECTNIGAGVVTPDLHLQVPSVTCEDVGSRNTPEPLKLDQEPTEAGPVTLCCR